MVLTHTIIELCPNCDQEWPARFGAHNCNFTKRRVHKNSVIIEPLVSLHESIDLLTGRMESQVCRSAQYADNAGEGDPYGDALNDIDRAIGQLKRFRSEIQHLAKHTHRWDGNDYCSICGADGRA
jgi:hypothetical protein